MASTKERVNGVKISNVKVNQEDNPKWGVARDIGCSQFAVPTILCNYKRHEVVKIGKHISIPGKTSKHNDIIQAILQENRKCPRKQIGRKRSQCLWKKKNC